MSDQQAAAPDVATLAIGILGGTGDQGRGLARRFALAGNPVIIGSRSAERAVAAALALVTGTPQDADGQGRDVGGGCRLLVRHGPDPARAVPGHGSMGA